MIQCNVKIQSDVEIQQNRGAHIRQVHRLYLQQPREAVHTPVGSFPCLFGLQPETCLILMIIVEIVCSLFIMVGFLTRISVIPPALSMIAAEYYILHNMLPHVSVYGLSDTQPGYLPIMFIGIYLYILLAGPGKISLDYFISLFLISRQGKSGDEELEDV